jgi:hypothetical protein
LPRDTRHRIELLSLCGAILMVLMCARAALGAASLNFPPSDFDILGADSGALIGHGHYIVDQTAHSLTLHGENRYLNGEYDLEEDKLNIVEDSQLPRLTSFRHDFFNAEGTRLVAARIDTETGEAECGKTVAGKIELVTEQLKFPDDTFAGASVLIPIQDFISRRNRSETLKLHVFNCAPTPRLILVDVKLDPRTETWVDYPPGELERIDIKPNFGFWTVVIQPFIPKLAAWFDPSQDMLLVGAQLQRYYKGTRIILARKREASISKAPTMAGAPPP